MKFIALKKEMAQIDSFSFHLKKVGKEEQIKTIISRRKEISNIGMKINK